MEYTDRLKKILDFARQEAERLGNDEVLPDHLMLGILRLSEGKAYELLMQAGLNPIELKTTLDDRLMEADTTSGTIKLGKKTERILRLGMMEAEAYHAEQMGTAHLLMGLLRERINYPAMYMEHEYAIDYECIERIFPKPELLQQDASKPESEEEEPTNPIRFIFRSMGAPSNANNGNSTPALTKYGRDLSEQAAKGLLDPVVGREIEIERVTQILSRRKKNNPILIGEPGVGKSAIVEGLAMRIAEGRIPALEGKRIVSLDLASMVAGSTYRGQFEERIKNVLNELKKHPEIILFVDEIHTLIGAGNAQGSLDAANILKPALARGEVQCIGATTTAEYRTSIEKDGALERRFQKVMIGATSKEDTFAILMQLSKMYGEHHAVHYTEEALHACVNLTDRYITDRAFPDKAIDAMDEAGARKRTGSSAKKNGSGRRPSIKKEDIAAVVSQMSGIPVQRVARVESEQLKHMQTLLERRVIGQPNAVKEVVKAIQRSRLGLKDPKKPIGVFFFLGPTGVGKTHLAQCLATEMFGTDKAIIRFDMSEYMEKHTVSLLVGAPPGYVAHEEGGKLTEAVRRKPYSVVLFDEIEKAHPDIFNVLLQVMDEGRLTDRQGYTVDFRNTIIIMTSNVGTRQLADFGSGIGFDSTELSDQRMEQTLMKALNRTFPPEFINRLDQVVIFKSLDKTSLEKILQVELEPLRNRITEMGYELVVSDATREKILKAGEDHRYGARPLKRAIQTYIEDAITDKMLEGKIEKGKITI